MDIDLQDILNWLVTHPSVIITTWIAISVGAIALLYLGVQDSSPAASRPPEAGKKPHALRVISKAEVARHTSEKDCWIIIDGKVYDVTSYVEEHPGGEAILKHAGGDSSIGFHGPQHPARVFDIIEDFCIGTVGDP